MAITDSSGSLLNIASSSYYGQIVKVALCDSSGTSLDQNSTAAEWLAAEITGDGYQIYQDTIDSLFYNQSLRAYETTITSDFFCSQNSYSYDSVVIFLDGSTYPICVISDSTPTVLTKNQTVTFTNLIRLSSDVEDLTAPVSSTLLIPLRESLASIPELDVPAQNNVTFSDFTSKFGTTSSRFSDGYAEFVLTKFYGLDDFCVEAFVYLLADDREYDTIITIGGGWSLDIDYEQMSYLVYPSPGSPTCTTAPNTAIKSQWQHVAIYRVNGMVYLAVDGVVDDCTLDGSANFNELENRERFVLGNFNDFEFPFLGHIEELRITYGSSPYGLSDFTPPSLPFSQ